MSGGKCVLALTLLSDCVKYADGDSFPLDRRRERRAVDLCTGRGALGVCRVVHPAHAGRAVPPAGRDDARAGRVGRKRPEGRAARLVVPGFRRVAGQPRRHGESRGRRHGHRRRGTRRGLLDVGHRPCGRRERFRRVDPRTALQTPRQGLFHRRSGLLHGTRPRAEVDGRAVRRADLRDLRIRLQLGAEQHDLRRVGGSFRRRSCVGGRRAHGADAAHHLRRHTAHCACQRRDRPDYGAGVHRAGAGRRAVQPRAAARSAGTDRRRRFRLGADAGRRGRRGVDAGHQAGTFQQRGRYGFGPERRRHGPRLPPRETGPDPDSRRLHRHAGHLHLHGLHHPVRGRSRRFAQRHSADAGGSGERDRSCGRGVRRRGDLPVRLFVDHRQLLLRRSQHPLHHSAAVGADALPDAGRRDGALRILGDARSGMEPGRCDDGADDAVQSGGDRAAGPSGLPAAGRLHGPEAAGHQKSGLHERPDSRIEDKAECW